MLWLAWVSETARRASRLAGWLRLVITGQATGKVMPVAPLVARVVIQSSREQATALVWRMCAMLEGRPLEPQVAQRLFDDGWMALMRIPSPSRVLILYLARIAGTHNIRRRGIEAIVPHVPVTLAKRLQKLHADSKSGEFMLLPDKDAHALILALIEAKDSTAVSSWALEHWRILPLAPPPQSLHVPHDAMWAEPTGGQTMADALSHPVPPPLSLLMLLRQASHRIRADRVKWFARVATELRVTVTLEGPTDGEGYVHVPRHESLALLHAIAAVPDRAIHKMLCDKVEESWTGTALQVPEAPVWVDCPGTFLGRGRALPWWGEQQHVMEVLTVIEVEARGPKCQWNGLTPAYAALAPSFPLAREGLEWLWPDNTLPLMCDRNCDPVAGSFFREIMAGTIEFGTVLEKRNGHGSMEMELALHE